MTRICLIRHGETDWNAARRLQGHTDIPLNARGQAQAHATALALRGRHFDALYCSDLLRAAQTADCLGNALELVPIHNIRLRERHFGAIQGLSWDEAAERYPALHGPLRAREPDVVPPGGGESLRAFSERITTTLAELATRHAGQCLLVVCHGGCLDVAYRQASGKPLQEGRDFALGNATLNWIGIEHGHWRLEHWNDDSHLEETGEEIST